MYFFSSVDIDDQENPIFYIDEDLTIYEDNNEVIILNGEYNMVVENGEKTIGEETLTYNSFIDVPAIF